MKNILPLILPNLHRPLLLALSVVLFMPFVALAQSADPYTEKLKAGDAKSASGDQAGAAADYEAAVADAQTPTQRTLALGKKAMALAQKQDFVAARQAAENALATTAPIEPVAQVIALQALAKCQLHEKNYASALESATRAGGLSGVEWAKPELAMIRGDAERGTGKFDAAVVSYRSILDLPGVSNEFKGVAWLNIGLTEQYSLNNGANAKEAYTKASELNPGLKAEIETHLAKIQ
jgi:tetratricopeptide (TPR) repeat protein